MSRLSFFLWSSGPDDELLDLAEQARLDDPAVLETQTRRMLADPRSKELVRNFAGRWLYLRNLRSVVPDAIAFPEFDKNLRAAFREETELFVDSLIRDNRSVLDLLGANYTFVNDRLAAHYGIRNVYGSHFRRVSLDAELAECRGGIFGHGSVLIVTSYPNRTSPVLRGKWILTNILRTPPAPPPADVPDLPTRGKDGQAATVRNRLQWHRESPACSVCHAPMDPLGLALENYDAIGGWRSAGVAGLPIDASGRLPDGTVFDGPAGLRTLLLERGKQFVGTVTERFLAYALRHETGRSSPAASTEVLRRSRSTSMVGSLNPVSAWDDAIKTTGRSRTTLSNPQLSRLKHLDAPQVVRTGAKPVFETAAHLLLVVRILFVVRIDSATPISGLDLLDLFLAQTEIVAELVDNGLADRADDRVVIIAVFDNRALVDRDPVGEHVAMRPISFGKRHALVEAVQPVRRDDPHLR